MASPFGDIVNPFNTLTPTTTNYTQSQHGSGLIIMLTNVMRIMTVGAGIYTLFNFVLAGFQFLSAGGDPKNISKAWEKIWQSFIGLIIIAATLILGAIVGWILFGSDNWDILISPRLFGP